MVFVMTADWIASQLGTFEPQRESNFTVIIPFTATNGVNMLSLACDSVDLPGLEITPIEIPYMNEYRYVAGKAKFAQTPITFKDFVDIDIASQWYQWVNQVYRVETGQIGFASSYKKTCEVVQCAPDGSMARSWKLLGAWPMGNNPGKHSHGGEGQVKIEGVIRYDKAIPSGLSGGLTASIDIEFGGIGTSIPIPV